MNKLIEQLGDRIQIISGLIVVCFVSVLVLSSQSAASYPSYFLALTVIFTFRQWNDVFSTKIIWFVVLLLTYLCLSSLWSTPYSTGDMVSMFVRGFLIFGFVIAIAECQLRGLIQRWLGRALAIAGGIAAVLSIVVFFLAPPADERLLGLGQLDNPVVAALIFGVVLIFLLEMLILEKSNYWRLVAILCFFVVLAAIYMTGSRNAWISLLIGASILLLAYRIEDRQKFLAGVAALGLLLSVALVALYVNEDTRGWIMPRGDSFRTEIWSVVLDRVWTDGKIFGLGILTADQVVLSDRIVDHPHNMYLAVLFQGGLLGLVALSLLIFMSLAALYRGYELGAAKLGLGIMGLALSSYFLDGHELVDKNGETWFLFWLPVAISVGISWRGLVQKMD